MSLDFSVSSITFSDGTKVATPPKGVTVFVGPNNSGKTAALRDILANLNSPHGASQARVIKDCKFELVGDAKNFRDWLQENADEDVDRSDTFYSRIMASSVPWRQLHSDWERVTPDHQHLGTISNIFCMYASVESRTEVVGQRIEHQLQMSERSSTPLSKIYADGKLEEEISKICKETFGHEITLQRMGAGVLRLGVPDADVPPLNRPTRAYATAEAALPLLAEQGHGLRSFMSIAILMLVQTHFVVLIDEPEAFLHPPQRRALGRLVGRLAARQGSQLFIATHDSDFLWGLLDSDAEVAVVRLTRDGNVNYAKRIASEDTKALWVDPLLRYSRLFDGLFYDRIVVAESDGDCRFYAAVLDHLVERGSLHHPDVLFVPAGGKDRIHVAVSALKSVGADVVAAVDFDALRDKESLNRLVSSCGANFENFDRLRNFFVSAISSMGPRKSISQLVSDLDGLLPEDRSVSLSRSISKKIFQLFSYRDGWTEAKKSGLRFVPSGDPYNACAQILDSLAEIGIFVCPVGELESFVKEVGGHGPSWVVKVLDGRYHENAVEAHRFVTRLVDRRKDGE